MFHLKRKATTLVFQDFGLELHKDGYELYLPRERWYCPCHILIVLVNLPFTFWVFGKLGQKHGLRLLHLPLTHVFGICTGTTIRNPSLIQVVETSLRGSPYIMLGLIIIIL